MLDNAMRHYDCEILYSPTSEELRFLPEGPYSCWHGKLSWVAIQHGADAAVGSVNLLDLATRKNTTFELPGRPGFAFPTNQSDAFVVGLERTLGIFDARIGEWAIFARDIDGDVTGTIINDGIVFEEGLIFGCKDLEFREKKAGLYFWRKADSSLHRLRGDQICSNGKALVTRERGLTLLDIDSPTRTVVAYPIDLHAPRLREPRIVVDLREGGGVPDGMILTPDEESVIVALYNPGDTPHGEARQFSLATGKVEAIWRTEASPQVTCPQLVEIDGQVKLVLTTAAEHMQPQRRRKYPNAGCIFFGDTAFDQLPPAPVFVL
jgi:sugar lactone lactonase YvrE